MKVIFLGTGEAFDENNPNNSSLVISEKTNLLLDCGFTTPYQLWKYNNDQNLLDVVYISHLHADHYFGLPALLLRMWEGKRTRSLTVICQQGARKVIREIMEYAYKGFVSKFEFEIKFVEIYPEQELNFNDLKLSFSETEHSRENSVIKVENNNKSVCYSGDGMFTKQAEEVYKDSDLVIQ
ncbi:ribonuclease Z, partial [Patescibacteria group bacterium]|nr:ribonuclease Z [Patescibacteria group bacterium]